MLCLHCLHPGDLCRGCGLSDRLHIALDIARGVAALHALGIIHTDLKPENCMLHPCASASAGWVGQVGGYGLAVKLQPGASFVSGTYH
ncbi:hypothetical protein DUNSADRAFT_6754, partial [Dunaliella salina]